MLSVELLHGAFLLLDQVDQVLPNAEAVQVAAEIACQRFVCALKPFEPLRPWRFWRLDAVKVLEALGPVKALWLP